jgi:Rps23 Pro-64 3,4-dihydroxylase Tpa1-like proline 4-hydroxylase
MSPFDFSEASPRRHPFPCFTVPRVLSEDSEEVLLHWLETEAPWRITVMDFYEQYEFDFKDVRLPQYLKSFFSEEVLARLREEVSALLGAPLGDQIDVTAHMLNKSQKIRIHNDSRPDGETHRFLVQLNRGWPEENGGMLMLFAGPEVETLTDILPPTSCSAFGFEISPTSYHAVSQVHKGDRFTLVFSFYALRP